MHAEPTILHTCAAFVVIDKPSGMLSVPGIGPEKQASAISWVKERFPHATGTMMVHRLDMDTSGVLVVALTRVAQAALSMQFEERVPEKTYVALCDGMVAVDEGVIDLPLRLDVDRRPYQIVDFVQGRPAKTFYRVLSRETDRTRVCFAPVTGRTHQLRVHAATATTILRGSVLVPGGLGSAIQGDVLYGDETTAPRLLLHAHTLALRDVSSGASGKWLRCESPVPF